MPRGPSIARNPDFNKEVVIRILELLTGSPQLTYSGVVLGLNNTLALKGRLHELFQQSAFIAASDRRGYVGAILHFMEDQGWIEKEIVPVPRRKFGAVHNEMGVYHITLAGAAALQDKDNMPQPNREMKSFRQGP
jgi:hypothetical protein